jgi:hypothetical protein
MKYEVIVGWNPGALSVDEGNVGTRCLADVWSYSSRRGFLRDTVVRWNFH